MGDKINVLTTLMNLTSERQILMNDHSRIVLTQCVKYKKREVGGAMRGYLEGRGPALRGKGTGEGRLPLGNDV